MHHVGQEAQILSRIPSYDRKLLQHERITIARRPSVGQAKTGGF
jgi:hypothetical protein